MALRSFTRVAASLQRLANPGWAKELINDHQHCNSLEAIAYALSHRSSLSTTVSHAHSYGCGCQTCLHRAWHPMASSDHMSSAQFISVRRASSTTPDESNNKEAKEEATTSSEGTEQTADAAAGEAEQNLEQIMKQLEEAKETEAKMHESVLSLTDKLKRSLAEMENVRTRSNREVETAKKFGAQGLIKDLLDVPDNLERAAASVPAEALAAEDPEKLRALLKGLLEGMQATEKIMLGVLRKQGVEQYNPMGEKFDPNLHSALFEVPDGSKEAGLVAVVTKRGYKMHERVIRPAEVGVTRAP